MSSFAPCSFPGCPEIARLLIDRGAYVDAKDRFGMDAFKVCAAMEKVDTIGEMFKYMKKHGMFKEPLTI